MLGWDFIGNYSGRYFVARLTEKYFSGPALGVVAGSKLPSYCIMSKTASVARKIEKLGEGMKIHISEEAKKLLDNVGGFRCDYRGTLELGVLIWQLFVEFDQKYFVVWREDGHILVDWT